METPENSDIGDAGLASSEYPEIPNSSSLFRRWSRGKVICGLAIVLVFVIGMVTVPSLFGQDDSYSNYILHSEDIDNTVWSKIGVQVDLDVADAPDGKRTAERITSQSSDGYITQWFNGLQSGTYDYSVYLKSDENVDLSLFVVTSSGDGTFIERVNVTTSSEWQRFTVVEDVDAGVAVAIQVGGGNSMQSGESVYVWGAQLSQSGENDPQSPQPYIRTQSTPASASASRSGSNERTLSAFATLGVFIAGAGLLAFLFCADSKRRIVGQWLSRWFPRTVSGVLNYPVSALPNFTVNRLGLALFVCLVLFGQFTLITPLTVYVSQPEAYSLEPMGFVLLGLGLAIFLSVGTTAIIALLPSALFEFMTKFLICISMAVAAEQLILADIKPFGALAGQPIAWEEYRLIAVVDLIVLFAILVGGMIYFRPKSLKASSFASGLVLFLATGALISLGIANQGSVSGQQQERGDAKDYEPFFEFSDSQNIFYYQPDSVSTDVVAKIFDEHPDLANEFEGFTFFADNLGAYNGTLISTYSVFTGRNANLYDDGYGEAEFNTAASENGFPLMLQENGFQTEFVPVYNAHCVGAPRVCVELHLRDLTPKALGNLDPGKVEKERLLLFDVSLFRHAPHVLKRHVYNTGDWVLRDWWSKRSAKSDVDTKLGVGPVLKETIDAMSVVRGAPPKFKWYAGLGAHQPEQYDENCNKLPKRIYSIDAGVDQTLCVLKEYAEFLRALKAAGIYNNTALILNADTGSGNLAFDLVHPDDAAHINNREGQEPNLNHLSMARPVLLVKPMGARGALRTSMAPTHQVNMPSTILDLAGIEPRYEQPSVFDLSEDGEIVRSFFRIYFPIQYGNVAMDFDEYEVIGRANVWDNYKLKDWARMKNSAIPEPVTVEPPNEAESR